jgi:high affinity Mn2+ porin
MSWKFCINTALFCCWLCAPSLARADEASDVAQAAATDNSPSFMKLLAAHGDHDLKRERWNAYFQFTYISSWKAPFSARYSNQNGSTHSLSAAGEHSFTATATLFFGLQLWPGAAAYWVPEAISSRPLSGLSGLGASIQNFELQKQGEIAPTLYSSRAYLSQTISLGGALRERVSGPMQLGTAEHSRRLLFALGNFSVLDFFDKNSVVADPRRQFFNIAFLTHGAFDFAADARGYAWGGVVELHYDDWALRFGRLTPPKDPNQLPIDFRIYKYYGDQFELEHAHHVFHRAGVVRLLGYRNREAMGEFADAISAFQRDPAKNAALCTAFNYGSANTTAPDLCWVRRPNTKIGLGVSFEQELDLDLAFFARAMVSDGRTEVYSYTSSDRSASLGAVLHGTAWRRPLDVVGAGYAASWISSAHAQYLKLGGIDGFIGDGFLNRASEQVFELFYSLDVYRSLWLSVDYQHLENPGYNRDRGPVNILAGRVHAEF